MHQLCLRALHTRVADSYTRNLIQIKYIAKTTDRATKYKINTDARVSLNFQHELFLQ